MDIDINELYPICLINRHYGIKQSILQYIKKCSVI
jgi:hypothetical protein